MTLRKVWYLLCSNCFAHTVLLDQSLQGKYSFQKYCTTDSGQLVVRCHGCERLSYYSEWDARHEGPQSAAQTRPPNVLWKITIKCASKNCESRTAIYMRGEVDLRKQDAESRVLLSRPMPKFSCEHALTAICPIEFEEVPDDGED